MSIRTQIFKEVDGEWVAADTVVPGEEVKARVFIETDFLTSIGQVMFCYDKNFFEDSYTMDAGRSLAVNKSGTSYTGAYGVEGTMFKASETNGHVSLMVGNGYVTQEYLNEHQFILVMWDRMDASKCQIMNGNEWFAEFDLIVREDATGTGDFFVCEESVATPDDFELFTAFFKARTPDSSITDVIGSYDWLADITITSNPVSIEQTESLTTGTCGENLTWSFDDSTGELTISGTGDMGDYTSSSTTPWKDLRKNIKSVVIEDGVTSIGDCAFENCNNLTSTTIPDSVTSIGNYAFRRCTSLTNITIPDSVVSIGDYAFSACTSVTSIIIPDSITNIGYETFSNCSSLTSITIPDSVTSIGDYAFAICYRLTSITIPDSVTSIGNSAFYNCSALASITIPDSVTSIGANAFEGCTALTTVNYNGTQSEWDAITIGTGNDNLLAADIIKKEQSL